VERKAFEVSPELVSQLAGIVCELKMTYGTVDIVGDDAGNYDVVDVNTTPTGPTFYQSGLLEHLRSAVEITRKSRGRFGRWLGRS